MTLTLALLIAVQAQSWQVTLDSLARNGEFSGVVLVARGGVPQFERAYINLGSINNAGYIVLGLLIERCTGAASSERPLPRDSRNIIVS